MGMWGMGHGFVEIAWRGHGTRFFSNVFHASLEGLGKKVSKIRLYSTIPGARLPDSWFHDRQR